MARVVPGAGAVHAAAGRGCHDAGVTTVSWVLLALAGLAATADWVAVAVPAKPLEYVAKPATLALLVGCALALQPVDGRVRAWFVVALVLCLAGDVLLMLPGRFVPGLAAFLLGHVAYVVGFVVGGLRASWLVAGVVLVAAALAAVGGRVLRGVAAGPRRALTVPVTAYMVVISTMVATAIGSAVPLAAAGALLFYASDTMIAEREFIRPQPWLPLAIMVTYHLGQAALVGSLVTG
jgi:uncharacterized membrane protein YhhN